MSDNTSKALQPELLSRIFIKCLPSKLASCDFKTYDVPTKLSLVCRSWAWVARDTPELWSKVAISYIAEKDNCQDVFKKYAKTLKIYLTRSWDTPLSFRYMCTGDPDGYERPVVFLLVSKSLNWGNVELVGPKFSFTPFLRALSTDVPKLTRLAICGRRYMYMKGFLDRAPKIQTLLLTDAEIEGSLRRFEHVRQLHVGHAGAVYSSNSFDEYYTWIMHCPICPGVEKLSVQACGLMGHWSQLDKPVTNANPLDITQLVSLTISAPMFGVTSPEYFMGCVRTPSLERLHIRCTSTHPSELVHFLHTLCRFSERCGLRWYNLLLASFHHSIADLNDVINIVPALRSASVVGNALMVDSSDVVAALQDGQEQGGGLLNMPIHWLRIWVNFRDHGPALRSLIEARSKAFPGNNSAGTGDTNLDNTRDGDVGVEHNFGFDEEFVQDVDESLEILYSHPFKPEC